MKRKTRFLAWDTFHVACCWISKWQQIPWIKITRPTRSSASFTVVNPEAPSSLVIRPDKQGLMERAYARLHPSRYNTSCLASAWYLSIHTYFSRQMSFFSSSGAWSASGPPTRGYRLSLLHPSHPSLSFGGCSWRALSESHWILLLPCVHQSQRFTPSFHQLLMNTPWWSFRHRNVAYCDRSFPFRSDAIVAAEI